MTRPTFTILVLRLILRVPFTYSGVGVESEWGVFFAHGRKGLIVAPVLALLASRGPASQTLSTMQCRVLFNGAVTRLIA